MTVPYTYLIGWPELNTWYYGVRWRPGCDPSDLWSKYFTSSKYVKAFRQNHGEPTVISIRKTFSDPRVAREWEHRVLARMKADVNPKFLNKTIDNVPTMLGRKHSEETKQKMSAWQKGQKKPREAIEKMRKALTGKARSPEARAACSRGHMGIEFSPEHKANIAASKLGRKHWTNGIEYRCCHQQPGPDWYLGKRRKKQA